MLSACADPNHEEWISWINPAFRPDPDIEGLSDSGDIKFKSIDVKLGVAMTAMLKSAGDAAMDLYLDVNRPRGESICPQGFEADQGQANHCDDVRKLQNKRSVG